jgi:hypothetical protein
VAPHRTAAGLRPPPDPWQPLGGDHLGDPGAVEPDALGGQRGGDLVDGVPGRAQLEDPLAGGILGRGGLRPRLGGPEELGCPGPEVAHRGEQASGGVAEPGGRLGGGYALGQVGAQRLVPALRRGGRGEEEFAARSGRGLGVSR